MNTRVKISSVIILMILLCGIVTGCGHKLSGKYSNKTDGVTTTFTFKSDGSWTMTAEYDGETVCPVQGNYYWDSSEHRYYLEYAGRNWWGGRETGVMTATPVSGELRISGNGNSMNLKKRT